MLYTDGSARHRSVLMPRRIGAHTRRLFLAFTAAALVATSCSSTSEGLPQDYTLPAQVLDLTNWKITLPIADGDQDRPVEILQPELGSYQSQYFNVADDNSSVAFRANVGGVPQPGSKFARSELREMSLNGLQQAQWSTGEGTHVMTIREAITHLPDQRPSIVAGQIHDDDEYIVLIRLDGNRLYAKADDKSIGDLDPDYKLGTIFTVRLEAAGSLIKVYYNDELKADYERECKTCYFKAGAYLQTNGGSADDYGEVQIYSLTVQHSPVDAMDPPG